MECYFYIFCCKSIVCTSTQRILNLHFQDHNICMFRYRKSWNYFSLQSLKRVPRHIPCPQSALSDFAINVLTLNSHLLLTTHSLNIISLWFNHLSCVKQNNPKQLHVNKFDLRQRSSCTTHTEGVDIYSRMVLFFRIIWMMTGIDRI